MQLNSALATTSHAAANTAIYHLHTGCDRISSQGLVKQLSVHDVLAVGSGFGAVPASDTTRLSAYGSQTAFKTRSAQTLEAPFGEPFDGRRSRPLCGHYHAVTKLGQLGRDDGARRPATENERVGGHFPRFCHTLTHRSTTTRGYQNGQPSQRLWGQPKMWRNA
jgi:hypothetical protein